MTAPNTGLQNDARLAVANALSGVLADTYALYFKTHAYHWNVTGPQFHTLHVMFEEQYREMWAALDVIAERIRALGVYAPASGKTLVQLSAISEAEEEHPTADKMVHILRDGHETLARRARKALALADDADDAASEDLLAGRIQIHEKTAWMLRSLAE